MNANAFNLHDREARLDEVLGAYFDAASRGDVSKPSSWIDQHPDLAGDLAEFFEREGRFQRLTLPLREIVSAGSSLERDFEIPGYLVLRSRHVSVMLLIPGPAQRAVRILELIQLVLQLRTPRSLPSLPPVHSQPVRRECPQPSSKRARALVMFESP
jgi:hypothetical protein